MTDEQAATPPKRSLRRSRSGRPPAGRRVRQNVYIPVEEWIKYVELRRGPLGNTYQDVLMGLIRLGYTAHMRRSLLQEDDEPE
jgi:hypothetical protein